MTENIFGTYLKKKKKHNKICLTVKLELAKYYKDSEMTALSPKGAGIKNS